MGQDSTECRPYKTNGREHGWLLSHQFTSHQAHYNTIAQATRINLAEHRKSVRTLSHVPRIRAMHGSGSEVLNQQSSGHHQCHPKSEWHRRFSTNSFGWMKGKPWTSSLSQWSGRVWTMRTVSCRAIQSRVAGWKLDWGGGLTSDCGSLCPLVLVGPGLPSYGALKEFGVRFTTVVHFEPKLSRCSGVEQYRAGWHARRSVKRYASSMCAQGAATDPLLETPSLRSLGGRAPALRYMPDIDSICSIPTRCAGF